MHVQRCDGCDYAFHYGSSDTVDLVVRISDLTACDLFFHYIYTLLFLFHPCSRIFVYRLAKSSLKGTGETVPAFHVYVVVMHVSDVRFLSLCSLSGLHLMNVKQPVLQELLHGSEL